MPGNIPLAIAVYPTQTSKYMSNPPTIIGNVLYFKILMRLSNIAGLINVTIIESLTASLPEVPTEIQLPDAFASPYNAYMVDNHTKLGTPTVALRLNGNWYHAGHYSAAGMNDTVLPVPPTMFDVSVPKTLLATATASALVAWSPGVTSFINMDSTLSGIYCMGLRVAPHQIVTKGFVPVDPLYFGTLIPGQIYYADSGANAGKLTTTPNSFPVGLGIYNNYIWLDLEAFQHIGYATYTTAGIVRWATQNEVNTGFADVTGPVVKPDTLANYVTNGSLFNLFQTIGGEWDSITISANYTPTKFNIQIKISEIAGLINVVLPDPTLYYNGSSVKAQGIRVFNASTISQTIYKAAGAFTGPYFTPDATYLILSGCIVDFISDGTNWIVIDHYRIATYTNYGIAREATMLEALTGVTTGPAPAFITPEELAAAIHGGTGDPFDPYDSFDIGSYIFAKSNGAGISAMGSTHTWTTALANGSNGILALCMVQDNEGSLYLPAGTWDMNNTDDSIANSQLAIDGRYSYVSPAGTVSVTNPPTITVPPGVWKVMYIASDFIKNNVSVPVSPPGAWLGAMITTGGLLDYQGHTQVASATIWLKRIS
jgi:hypothetical protein